jgi:hypothetical protein
MRRWIRCRRDTQRVQLADDARRLAGYADAVVDRARRLGAPVPGSVALCPLVWRYWSWQLQEWARGEGS